MVYPPFTPFLGRVELILFGESLAAFRFLAAAAQSVAIVLTASMAKRMGANGSAQWLAALAVAISGVSLAASSLFQYVSFDYLWWVLTAWMIARMIETNNPRWWLAIGAVVGLGFLTKYTILFLIVGLVVGVLATPMRKHLGSRWLWFGAALALIIASPNLLWQMKHDFITLQFLKSIHARDVSIGRTHHFLLNQLFVPASPITIPLWAAGVVAVFGSKSLRRFRMLGWMGLTAFVILAVARGRDYYAAPIYPMLFAAGATWLLSLIASRPLLTRFAVTFSIAIMFLAGAVTTALICPVAPVGSNWWRKALDTNADLGEEIGWPELVAEVARIRNTLPENERSRTAVYCANYGEGGAINLYGPRYGLPPAISGTNSFFARGYGDPPPENVIVLGGSRERLEQRFESVALVGRVPNPLAVRNEESRRPDIFLCRGLKTSWSELWRMLRSFG